MGRMIAAELRGRQWESMRPLGSHNCRLDSFKIQARHCTWNINRIRKTGRRIDGKMGAIIGLEREYSEKPSKLRTP